MKFFRSYIPVFKFFLVLVTGGFLFSADAQDDALEVVPRLDLEDFSAVEIPDEFNFGENFIWGAKALFSHKDAKEIVPVSAYKRKDVCSEDPNQQPAAANAEVGALVLLFQRIIDETAMPTATAVWSQSLEEACNLDVGEWPVVDIGNQSDNTKVWDINKSELFLPLATHLSNQGSNEFILTVGQLNNVAVDPTREYWWRCRDDQPPSQNSVCRATLALSPYKQHRDLIR